MQSWNLLIFGKELKKKNKIIDFLKLCLSFLLLFLKQFLHRTWFFSEPNHNKRNKNPNHLVIRRYRDIGRTLTILNPLYLILSHRESSDRSRWIFFLKGWFLIFTSLKRRNKSFFNSTNKHSDSLFAWKIINEATLGLA